jgi:hypothetical protein
LKLLTNQYPKFKVLPDYFALNKHNNKHLFKVRNSPLKE